MAASIPVRRFYDPILRTLHEAAAPLGRREIAARAADALGLSEEDRLVRLPSGKHQMYRHRAGWALNELKRAGFVENPERGRWAITESGRSFIEAHPSELSAESIAEVRRRIRQELKASNDEDASAEEESPAAEFDEQSPEESIEQALRLLKESVVTDLIQRLKSNAPGFFEKVVLDVLHASGYGANREALTQVGGSGDGGIDGIISLDRLGLEKVYVQAKRWQGNVGRPEIQAFFGALSGRRANRGVFITTSAFTREAREFADSVSDTLVLVNGRKLAELMMESGVGVQLRSVAIPAVDSDYFEED